MLSLSNVMLLCTLVACSQAYDAFDYLMFAQHWPTSECILSNEAASGSCATPSSTGATWTIHGLWPSRFRSNGGPQFCHPPDKKFDWSKIQSLEQQLIAGWPNIVTDEKETEFWAYEWTKHGTCAEEVEALRGTFNYFNQALALRNTLNIVNMLQSANITPSAIVKYQTQRFHDAIVNQTGKIPKFECVEDPKDKSAWYINSIRICIDKSLSPIDCPGETDDLTSHHRSTNRSPKTRVYDEVLPPFQLGNHLPPNKPCPQSTDLIYPPFNPTPSARHDPAKKPAQPMLNSDIL